MNKEFGLKELYSVFLKTTYPMEINGKKLEEGEIIAAFDKIQIANFDEIRQQNAATGGYDNRALVLWDETKGVNFTFTQGVFSKTQLAWLTNNQLVEHKEKEKIILSKREFVESNDEGCIELSYAPKGKFFVYDQETFAKLETIQIDNSNLLQIVAPSPLEESSVIYKNVIVDYNFEYENSIKELVIGNRLYDGYISLEGQTKIVDDNTGIVRTGVIRIPRLKINSSLNLTLGEKVPPVSGTFQATGYPVGKKGDKKVMEILFLEDDIDSDIL